ncbi:MAG: hypothetical protein RIR86_16 [Acidobacteriota bacterium]|jgi:hypothetical protein
MIGADERGDSTRLLSRDIFVAHDGPSTRDASIAVLNGIDRKSLRFAAYFRLIIG